MADEFSQWTGEIAEGEQGKVGRKTADHRVIWSSGDLLSPHDVYYERVIRVIRRFKFAIILPLLNLVLAWAVFRVPAPYADLGPTSQFAQVGFANSVCYGINSPALALWNASYRVFRISASSASIQSSLVYIGIWWFLVGIAFDVRDKATGPLGRGLRAMACMGLGTWVLFLAIRATPSVLFALTVLYETARYLRMMGGLIDVTLSFAWGGFLIWVGFKQLRSFWFSRVTAA